MIVIANIAILAALLLPALRSARETAKKAGCINNQKNINMYIHQYADQNRQTFYLLDNWQDWYIKMALMAGGQYKKALSTGDSLQYDPVNSYNLRPTRQVGDYDNYASRHKGFSPHPVSRRTCGRFQSPEHDPGEELEQQEELDRDREWPLVRRSRTEVSLNGRKGPIRLCTVCSSDADLIPLHGTALLSIFLFIFERVEAERCPFELDFSEKRHYSIRLFFTPRSLHI